MTNKRYMIVHSQMPSPSPTGKAMPDPTDRMEALVTSYIDEGWVCQGGPFYMERVTERWVIDGEVQGLDDDENYEPWWGQAMVRGYFLHRLLNKLKPTR